jgi:hypothetical protein
MFLLKHNNQRLQGIISSLEAIGLEKSLQPGRM